MNNYSIERAIILAKLGISKLPTDIYYIDGMSSPNNRRLLNILCETPNTNYLEIGCWKGSTLVSALYGNKYTVDQAIAIDNFSEFEKPLFTNSINFQDSITHNPKIQLSDQPVIEQCNFNIQTYIDHCNLKVFNHNCFDLEFISKLQTSLLYKINLYFYDGNHSEESQYNAITNYDILMADQFTLVVDDWDDGNAAVGTRRAIQDMKYKVLTEYILPAKGNGDIWTWWNGLGIFRLQKET